MICFVVSIATGGPHLHDGSEVVERGILGRTIAGVFFTQRQKLDSEVKVPVTTITNTSNGPFGSGLWFLPI